MKTTICAALSILLLALATSEAAPANCIEVRGEVETAASCEVTSGVGGRVKKLHVHSGDRVKAGDLLVEVEDEMLANTKIHAPRGGTVLAVPVREGQPITTAGEGIRATVLVTIADLSNLIVQAHLKETDAAKLTANQSVQIMLPAVPDQRMTGTVSFIAPIATAHEVTFQATIQNPIPQIQRGTTVQVTIPIAVSDGAR